MTSRTPRFDAALEEYFSSLVLDESGGQRRTCALSGKRFYARPEDIAFYRSIKVPLPTLSPNERARRKFAFSNSYNLYKRACSFSGNPMISQYPDGVPFPVYEHAVWQGDVWNPLTFGRVADPHASLFTQVKALMDAVPRPSLNQEGTMVNSEYCHNAGNLKNCYLVFASNDSEECLYSVVAYCKNSMDLFAGVNCDTCYDCFEAYDSWKCFYSDYIKNCQESYFLYDCRSCTNCFGGTNLRNRKYVFFNEQLTKEEYEEKMHSISLGDANTVAELKARFEELKKGALHKPVFGEQSVESTGNYLHNSSNCHMCFYPLGCENCSYSVGLFKARDCYDVVGGVSNERCYDSFPGMGNYGLKFSYDITGSRDLEYSQMCTNSRDCFGSVGLKNKSFCIFNVQYTEEEYWKRVDELKTAMLARGEYGEFFPGSLSPFPYVITEAMSYGGFDDWDEAVRYGYRNESAPPQLDGGDGEAAHVDDTPPDIMNIGDEILTQTLLDRNGKKFRIVPAELAFYRANSIPLPRYHYSTRIQEKRKKLGSIAVEVYERACQKCGIEISSVFSPSDPRIVYCESCYVEALA